MFIILFIAAQLLTALYQATVTPTQTTDPSAQGVLTTLSIALAAGCGWAIQWLYGQYLDYLQNKGKPNPSPFVKRWQMIGLTLLVPTVLYAVHILGQNSVGTATAYSWLLNIAYVGTAFFASQGAHSFELPKQAATPGAGAEANGMGA